MVSPEPVEDPPALHPFPPHQSNLFVSDHPRTSSSARVISSQLQVKPAIPIVIGATTRS